MVEKGSLTPQMRDLEACGRELDLDVGAGGGEEGLPHCQCCFPARSCSVWFWPCLVVPGDRCGAGLECGPPVCEALLLFSVTSLEWNHLSVG